jgi:hypothetical protein
MVWNAGTATGLGPFPGTDPLEAARIVFSELPGLPFLPELPARGVGADPVGRTAGLLADLHVEVGAGVWRFVPRGGRDEQRARTTLMTDLDALEEAAEGYQGPFKLRIVGPWSLAASIELGKGEKALADPGAVRDVAASLAEGLTRHVADIRRRISGVSRFVVELDEPFLPAVLAGELATASGWGRLRSYEQAAVEGGLRQVFDSLSRPTAPEALGGGAGPTARPAADRPGRRAPVTVEGDGQPDGGDGGEREAGVLAGIRIGAGQVGGDLLRRAGADFLGLDGAVLDSVDEDGIGEAIDAGLGLLVACVPLEAPQNDPRRFVEPVTSLWKRLGFLARQLSGTGAVAPVDGLERLDVGAVPAVLRRAVEAGRYLDEFAAEETS